MDQKEHPHIYSGSLKDNEDSVRFNMDVDFMFSAWQASANREGYKFVPVEPTQKMISAGMGVFSFPLDNGRFSDCELIFSYREMIGACDE